MVAEVILKCKTPRVFHLDNPEEKSKEFIFAFKKREGQPPEDEWYYCKVPTLIRIKRRFKGEPEVLHENYAQFLLDAYNRDKEELFYDSDVIPPPTVDGPTVVQTKPNTKFKKKEPINENAQ